MTEYPIYKMDEALRKGLNPLSRESVNLPFLTRALNGVPYPDGLRPTKIVRNAFTSEVDWDFPFPQLFVGMQDRLLLTRDTLFTADVLWNLTEQDTYNYVDGTTPNNIVPDSAWQFVDWIKAWALFNGASIVFKDNPDFNRSGQLIKVCNNVCIKTGTTFRARMLTAGFNASTSWQSGWRDLLTDVQTDLPSGMQDLPYQLESNFVLSSSIGQSDFAFRWLLYPEEAITGYVTDSGFTDARPLFQQALLRNEFSIIPIPAIGVPRVLSSIGNNLAGKRGAVIVFGTDSIVALVPYSSPITTFGVKMLWHAGIKGRIAMAGDDNEIIFVDTENCLCRLHIDQDTPEIIPLGYTQYLTAGDYAVSMIKRDDEREYYISSDEECFVLSRHGLGEHGQRVTSVYQSGDSITGTSDDFAVNTMEVTSSPFNGNLTGQKLTQQVQVTAEDHSNLRAELDYRNETQKPFRTSRSVPINKEGFGVLPVSANQFQLTIRAVSEPVHITSATVLAQRVDRRSRRGPEIDLTATGSGQ